MYIEHYIYTYVANNEYCRKIHEQLCKSEGNLPSVCCTEIQQKIPQRWPWSPLSLIDLESTQSNGPSKEGRKDNKTIF